MEYNGKKNEDQETKILKEREKNPWNCNLIRLDKCLGAWRWQWNAEKSIDKNLSWIFFERFKAHYYNCWCHYQCTDYIFAKKIASLIVDILFLLRAL